jgi:hypothetical protein
MTASRYFIAAAIVLLLGAAAMPVGLAGYAIASTSREASAVAIGVWSVFVLVVAVAGPIALLIAGIISLLTGGDD